MMICCRNLRDVAWFVASLHAVAFLPSLFLLRRELSLDMLEACMGCFHLAPWSICIANGATGCNKENEVRRTFIIAINMKNECSNIRSGHDYCELYFVRLGPCNWVLG